MKYLYCDKCGRVYPLRDDYPMDNIEEKHQHCDYCHSTMIPSARECRGTFDEIHKTEAIVYEQYIKGDPLKEILFQKREEEAKARSEKFRQELKRDLAKYDAPVRCPKCGHASVVTGTRGFSVWSGFIGSNKTMNRCGNCGYKWYPGK